MRLWVQLKHPAFPAPSFSSRVTENNSGMVCRENAPPRFNDGAGSLTFESDRGVGKATCPPQPEGVAEACPPFAQVLDGGHGTSAPLPTLHAVACDHSFS